jgi:hypothetical protein
MIARSIPGNNTVVHGFVDGARAASDKVDQWKHLQLERPAAPAPPRPSKPRRSSAATTKPKRKASK